MKKVKKKGKKQRLREYDVVEAWFHNPQNSELLAVMSILQYLKKHNEVNAKDEKIVRLFETYGTNLMSGKVSVLAQKYMLNMYLSLANRGTEVAIDSMFFNIYNCGKQWIPIYFSPPKKRVAYTGHFGMCGGGFPFGLGIPLMIKSGPLYPEVWNSFTRDHQSRLRDLGKKLDDRLAAEGVQGFRGKF